MDYETETKAATDRPPPALTELKRMAEVIDSLDGRVDFLTRRLEMVLEPEGPEKPSPNGMGPDTPATSPLINELRHLATRAHRIEGRLASLTSRIQV